MTNAQTEAQAILRIDDKWSVEYDPANNDRPISVLRYGEQTSTGVLYWQNDTVAMFYALLARDIALAAKNAELAEMSLDRDRLSLVCKQLQGVLERAEAQLSERAGGVKVRAIIEALKEATHYDCIPSKTESAIDQAIAFLSALTAEPAAPEGRQEAMAVDTYYTKGKDAEHFERLPDKDFAWALTCAAQDLNDSDENVSEWMPVTALLSDAADRIERLTRPAEQAVTEAMVEAAANELGFGSADSVRIRAALKAAMEAGR